MTKRLQFKRYPSPVANTIVGADGELIINTTSRTISVHDGHTPGGSRLLNLYDLNNIPSPQPAFNQANTATVLAQAAFNLANTESSQVFTQYTANTANSAQANTIYTQGVDLAQNTNISSAITLAQSAYNAANAAGSNQTVIAAFNQANSAYNIATSASSNTIYLQNGLNSANANIAYLLITANNALPNTGSLITVNSASRFYVSNTIPSTSNTTGALVVGGGVGITGNLYVGGTDIVIGQGPLSTNVNIGTAGSTGSTTAIAIGSSSGTSTTTINGGFQAPGTSGQSINIGSGQSSQGIFIGGTGSTGAITIGRSLVSQTLNLFNAVTASGSTSTINIGASGASGSITNINIGSSLGTSTSTVNGNLLVGGTSSFGTASAQYIQAVGDALYPQVKAVGSGTDIPLVLQPKGTGALQAQLTDSTTTGGNARGINSVDWQTNRNNANQVASGQYSFVGGGQNNRASGNNSVVVGGYGGAATGANATVIGGGFYNSGNQAQGDASVVLGGWGNTAGGTASVINGGNANIADGAFSTIVGGVNGATKGITGFMAFPACNQPFGYNPGGSQGGLLVLARQTTDATATVLTSTGLAATAINQIILPNNSAYYFKGSVTSIAQYVLATTAAVGNSTTATLTFAAQTVAPYIVGQTIVVAGVTPTGYNGTFTVTACTTTTVSYLNATTGAQTVAGTITGSSYCAAWDFSGQIMRSSSAAGTRLVGTPQINRVAADTNASTWSIALTANTTNGGLAVTVTGAAATTIRWVGKIETTEVNY